MIEILQLGRKSGYERLTHVIEQALKLGTYDAAAVCYLLRTSESEVLAAPAVPPLRLTMFAASTPNDIALLPQHFERPLPSLNNYDLLLTARLPIAKESGPLGQGLEALPVVPEVSP